MFAAKQGDSPIYDHPSKTFIGVRFVLHGLDPINSQKVRSKLVNGGGVDVRQYGPSCTHVIVDKLVYDDPICVLARRDGKVLVTGLWVDHSFDIGMPADPTSVMYRPLTDLDGIPGAKSLIVCLTGYQRQDRDDIMIMVGLMGASFSKPLVANKVTHLICYKFEGEKYELAKKMKTIKLVNHRWLEDCLRAWEILPEANYDRSGYELEMMEAEAKDSEEEEEAKEIGKKQNGERKINLSPHNLHVGMIRTDPSPQSKNISMNLLANSASKGLPNAHNKNDAVLATAEKDKSFPALNLQGISKKQPDVLSSRDSRALGNVTCSETSELALESHDRIIAPVKVGNDLGSTSGSGERSPHSDADMSSAVNYLKNAPRRNTLTMSSGGMGSNLSIPSKVLIDKVNVPDGFDISLSGVEKAKVVTDTGSAKTPAKEDELINEEGKSGIFLEKRKMDVSYDSSKLRKTSHNPKPCNSESPLFFSRTGASEHRVLINDASDMSATLGIGHDSPINAAMTSFSSFDRKSLNKSLLNSSVSENKQEVNLVAPQTSSIGFKSMNLSGEHGIKNVFNKAENPIGEVGKPQEEMQNVHVPSPQTKGLETDKSNSPSMDLFKGINTASVSKPVRRKVIAKKSLGCKPNVGPGSATSHRGPIFLNETAFRSDAATCLSSGQETTSRRMTVEPGNAKIIPPTANDDGGVLRETQNPEKLGDEVENKMASMDDETENPEDKEGNEFDGAGGEEKLKEVNTTNEMNMVTKDKSEDSQLTTRQANANSLSPRNDREISNGDKNGAEVEKEASGREDVLAESTTCEDGGKLAKQKKFKLGKTLRKTPPYITERKKSKQVLGEESNNKNNKNVPNDEEKYPNGKIKRTKRLSNSKDSMEIGKENRPVDIGDKNVNLGEQQVGKVAVKSGRTPIKVDPKACMSDQDSIPEERVLKMKAEPAWFILSGHKLQRKEFQRVIRHLKGRLCRDSHQWSYQATHFVVSDPIRRTEKFFAAAASGRWILKTDYLTESNQAGRFLREEPFEWHKNGLSEDGAINLEAPRKWRLLRERTGHGAFYGMRIVIYGECIAPPLDTLKRVIKAGDGTILATSPPYSRFLNSGVDFAIVSPGMPRVDMWVQEFLGHEVPCVTADYLVEYVCKPGFSLERHVQYNTHAWAERSFANLQTRLHEVVELQTTCKGNVDDDLQCQVCGSADRGEVMLVCGDEGGSTGCGVGVHIDCCSPPLEQVPDEDWFCPKCSETRNGVNCRKKGISKGK